MSCSDPAFFQDPSGCTAVAALLTHDRRLFVVSGRHAGKYCFHSNLMFQANAGDSRSVLSCKGFAKPMSYDHKPTNDSERTGPLSALPLVYGVLQRKRNELSLLVVTWSTVVSTVSLF